MLSKVHFFSRLGDRVIQFAKTVSFGVLLLSGLLVIGASMLLGLWCAGVTSLESVTGIALTAFGCIIGTSIMNLALIKLMQARLAAHRGTIEAQVRAEIATRKQLDEGQAAKLDNERLRSELAHQRAMRVSAYQVTPEEKWCLIDVKQVLLDHRRIPLIDLTDGRPAEGAGTPTGLFGAVVATASSILDQFSRRQSRHYVGVLRYDFTAQIGIKLSDVKIARLPDGRLHVSNWKPRQLSVHGSNSPVFEICELRSHLLVDEGANIKARNEVVVEEFILPEPDSRRSGDLRGKLRSHRDSHEREVRQRAERGSDHCEQLALQVAPWAKLRIKQVLGADDHEILFEETEGIVAEGALDLPGFLESERASSLESSQRQAPQLPSS